MAFYPTCLTVCISCCAIFTITLPPPTCGLGNLVWLCHATTTMNTTASLCLCLPALPYFLSLFPTLCFTPCHFYCKSQAVSPLCACHACHPPACCCFLLFPLPGQFFVPFSHHSQVVVVHTFPTWHFACSCSWTDLLPCSADLLLILTYPVWLLLGFPVFLGLGHFSHSGYHCYILTPTITSLPSCCCIITVYLF